MAPRRLGRRRLARQRRVAAAMVLSVGLLHPAAAAPPGAGPDCAAPGPVQRRAALPPGFSEVSGLAASERYPGWGWMVRDSANPPSLYAVRFRADALTGEPETPLVREFPVAGADNTDWEDVVYARNGDGSGRLYVVESGQTRRDRFIFKLGEPDPLGPNEAVRARRYRYAYPDGAYNTEAVLFHQSRLVLVTKTNPARVYRFEGLLRAGRLNRPRFLGILSQAPNVSVTRISPDGRYLVAATHQRLYLFAGRPGRPADGPAGNGGIERFLGHPPTAVRPIGSGDNVEAGDYFPARTCGLVLVAESRNVYRSDPAVP